MIQRLLPLALLFGFWLPPLLVGRWIAGRRQRAFNIPWTAVIWSLIWLVSNILLIPPYVRKGPTDYSNGPIYMAIGFMGLAFWVVLPGSAIACWIGTRHRRAQDDTGGKLEFALSLVIFGLIQAIFIAYMLLT